MANTSDAYRLMFQWLPCQITGRIFFFLSLVLQISSYIRLHFCSILFVMCFFYFPLELRYFGWNHTDECERGFRYSNLARACVCERGKKTITLETTTLFDLKKKISALITFTQIKWNNHISYILCYAMLYVCLACKWRLSLLFDIFKNGFFFKRNIFNKLNFKNHIVNIRLDLNAHIGFICDERILNLFDDSIQLDALQQLYICLSQFLFVNCSWILFIFSWHAFF